MWRARWGWCTHLYERAYFNHCFSFDNIHYASNIVDRWTYINVLLQQSWASRKWQLFVWGQCVCRQQRRVVWSRVWWRLDDGCGQCGVSVSPLSFHQQISQFFISQLGFDWGQATRDSQFGQVFTSNFAMDEVNCNGDEDHLQDCEYESVDDCGLGEGAGVICHYNNWKVSICLWIKNISRFFNIIPEAWDNI